MALAFLSGQQMSCSESPALEMAANAASGNLSD